VEQYLSIHIRESIVMAEQRNRGERLQVMLDFEELAALDDYRFEHRMPSRAAAIRELLRQGLAAKDKGSASAGVKSSEFGVINVGRQSRGPASA
jgi:hypothetical protein